MAATNQVKSMNWYGRELTTATEGMIADSTNSVIDSLSATAEIIPGHPVVLSAAGQVAPVTTDALAATVIGVAAHSHIQPTAIGVGIAYESGDTVPVVTFGDVYVQLGAANTTAGVAAAVASDTENGAAVYRFVPYVSGSSTTFAVANATILDTGSAGDLVRLRIRK